MNSKTFFRLLVACLASILAGCPGSSSTNTPSSPQTYAIDRAISVYLQENHSYNFVAVNSTNTFYLQFNYGPDGMGSFQGQAADTATKGETLSENGIVISSNWLTYYFLLGPYLNLGAEDNNGYVYVSSNQVALPDNATIGSHGTFYTTKIYLDSTLHTQIGTMTTTWDLSAGTGSNAIACLADVETLYGTTNSESDCYTLDPYNDIISFTPTLDENGTVLNFQ